MNKYKKMKMSKNQKRSIYSNKILNGKPAIAEEEAVDYVKKLGFIVINPTNEMNLKRILLSMIVIMCVLLTSFAFVKADTYNDCSIYGTCSNKSITINNPVITFNVSANSSDKQVLFNQNGSITGVNKFVFDYINNILYVTNGLDNSSLSPSFTRFCTALDCVQLSIGIIGFEEGIIDNNDNLIATKDKFNLNEFTFGNIFHINQTSNKIYTNADVIAPNICLSNSSNCLFLNNYYNKSEVLALIPSNIKYYFYNTTTGITGYTKMNETASNGFILNSTITSGLSNNQVIATRINQNINITRISQGVIIGHTHVTKTAGLQDLQVFGQIIIRNSSGSEKPLINTSLSDVLVNGVGTEINLIAPVQETDLNVTDMLVWKLTAKVSGSGTAPTIQVDIMGNTFAGLSLPVNTQNIVLSSSGMNYTNLCLLNQSNNFNKFNLTNISLLSANNGSFINLSIGRSWINATQISNGNSTDEVGIGTHKIPSFVNAPSLWITSSTTEDTCHFFRIDSGKWASDCSIDALSNGVINGISDTSSFWLCSSSDCSTTCQVQINNGAIVGCV